MNSDKKNRVRAAKPLILLLILTLCFCSGSSLAGGLSPADVPEPRVTEYDWMSVSEWYHKHADDVAVARKGGIELLFLGDSITESWDWEGHEEVFEEFFSQYRSANFGIGGDQTQNLLWRLQYGDKGDLDPAVVVLLIGVNNFNHGGHSAEEVYTGIGAVVAQVRKNYPNAKVLVNGIFPYGQSADSPGRQKVKQTNHLVSGSADRKNVFFYDFGSVFVDDKGDIPQKRMADYLHPTAEGLRLYAHKIRPIVDEWLKGASTNSD